MIHRCTVAALFVLSSAVPFARAGTFTTAEETAAIAVNDLSVTVDGLVLTHPRHHAVFRTEGVSVRPAAGSLEWHWSLTGVRNDGAPLPLDLAVTPIQSSRHQVEDPRGAILERYLLRAGCVEQQFVIEAALPGKGGDLELEGRVESSGRFAPAALGWRWSDDNGEVTLGNVTVFDATGSLLTARMTVSHDRTRISVDGGDLARATYPVTIDPEIGANDFRISTMGPEFVGRATRPAIAYSTLHDEYLIVWTGHHKRQFPSTNHFDVYGQFIEASTGERLGPEAFVISETAPNGDASFSGANQSDVAYNPDTDEFLVAWGSDDDGDGMVAGETEIFVQRIDASTRQEIGADLRISVMGPDGSTSYSAGVPALAYDPAGGSYLVVWAGSDTVPFELEIYGQRLSGDTAAEIGTSDFRISDMGPNGSTSYAATSPHVVFNPAANEFLVAWSGSDDTLGSNEFEIWAQRLDATTGAEVGANDVRISEISNSVSLGKASSPSIAYNNLANEYLVVFSAETPPTASTGRDSPEPLRPRSVPTTSRSAHSLPSLRQSPRCASTPGRASIWSSGIWASAGIADPGTTAHRHRHRDGSR